MFEILEYFNMRIYKLLKELSTYIIVERDAS